jgi:hypothetical protein
VQSVERVSVTFCKSPLSERGTSQAIKNSEPEMTSAESNQRARASKLLGAGTEMRGLSRGGASVGPAGSVAPATVWVCGSGGRVEGESSEVR